MNYIVQIILIFVLVCTPAAFSHDHLKAEYVPWGIDEYELFDLTKDKLAKDFKSKLHFNKELSEGYLTRPEYGPHFLLTYDNNKVSSVQRMFIDGYGCHIMGPVLNSKKEALQFSIDGLTTLPNGGDKQDKQRLLAAKKLLGNYTPGQNSK
jgi:hypothetical protein